MTDTATKVENSTQPAIEFENVSVQFIDAYDQPMVALDDVSFSITRGVFTSVIGPSGCGKTTLLRLLAGLEQSSSGTTSFHGRPVEGLNTEIGFITQDSNLYPWMTVRANIEFPLEMHGVPEDERHVRADNFIALIGLTGFEEHYPHQLSGGMQKRVSVARTLIYEPDIVLMDEPFSALDAQTRMALQSDLQEMWRARGQTTMLVTHDLTEAIALSDQIVVMTSRPGKVLQIFDIPLPRPRDIFDVQAAPGFAELYDSIWDPLKEEVFAAGGRIGGRAVPVNPTPITAGPSSNGTALEETKKQQGFVTAPGVTRRARPRRERTPLKYHLYRLMIVFAILGLWEGLSDNGIINNLIFSHPAAIFPRFWLMITNQEITGVTMFPQIKITMEEWVLGYAIGSAGAVVIGFLMGRARSISAVVQPLILLFFGLPIIAIAPLFVVVFGIGLSAKVVTAMITSFFATFFQVYSGAANIPEVQVQLARLMGASRFQVVRKILLPATMPFVFIGLRIGVPAAMIGAIVGEFIVSNSGIGWFILRCSATLDAEDLFAVLALLMILVYILGQLMILLQGRALRWQPKPSRIAVRRPPAG